VGEPWRATRASMSGGHARTANALSTSEGPEEQRHQTMTRLTSRRKRTASAGIDRYTLRVTLRQDPLLRGRIKTILGRILGRHGAAEICIIRRHGSDGRGGSGLCRRSWRRCRLRHSRCYGSVNLLRRRSAEMGIIESTIPVGIGATRQQQARDQSEFFHRPRP